MNEDDPALERDKRLRGLIDKGSEITGEVAGAAAGSAIGMLFGGPPGAIIGAGIGAATATTVKSIGHELSSRLLSPREQVRVGGVFTLAAADIVDRCRNGENVRDDSFFEHNTGERSDAEEVWESVLLKSQRESEEKKLPYMAHLLSNLAFNTEISAALAQQLSKAAESMTYRQFCILRLSVIKERFNLRQDSYRGHNRFTKDLCQILYEYHDLYNMGMINFGRSAAISITDVKPGLTTSQALGFDVYKEMCLHLIPDDDIAPIAEQLG